MADSKFRRTFYTFSQQYFFDDDLTHFERRMNVSVFICAFDGFLVEKFTILHSLSVSSCILFFVSSSLT